MKSSLFVLFILFLLSFDAHCGTDDRVDQLILRFKTGELRKQTNLNLHRITRKFGPELRQSGRKTHLNDELWDLSRPLTRKTAQHLIRELVEASVVESAEANIYLKSHYHPNDPFYVGDSQRYLKYLMNGGLGVSRAWDYSQGSGTTVAVLDTGYRPHGDLFPNIMRDSLSRIVGFDFVSSVLQSGDGNGIDVNPEDPGTFSGGSPSSWHGTSVAGIVSAVTNNSTGIAGIAPLSKFIPVRVLGKGGVGSLSDVANGIKWAARGYVPGAPISYTKATVINLSLGSLGTCTSTLQSAIDFAISAGSIVVVSAGNAAALASQYVPANCRGVIVVGAGEAEYSTRSSYSNYGPAVTLVAPGDYIVSTWNAGTTLPTTDAYGVLNGTSFAAPLVSGAILLLKSRYPTLNRDSVLKRLIETAKLICFDGPTPAYPCVRAPHIDVAKALDPTLLFVDAPSAITGYVRLETNQVGVAGAALSARIPMGVAPYTYSWVTNNNQMTISNQTSSNPTISGMVACHDEYGPPAPYPHSLSGTVALNVRDASGRVSAQDISVHLTAQCGGDGGGGGAP